MRSHLTELEYRLKVSQPDIIAITETFLDKSVKNLCPIGYVEISRLDRRDGRQAGGIAVFVKASIKKMVVHIADSNDFERSWHIIHTNFGPVLFSVWYRPPCYGEVASIFAFETEWRQYSVNAVATIAVGDMNVHNVTWLQYSSGTTPEGKELCNVCSRLGLIEKVKKNTRGQYLLDLFLTDIPTGIKCQVLPKISDHQLILSSISIAIERSSPPIRDYWLFEKANWRSLDSHFCNVDWHFFFSGLDVDAMVTKFTNHVLNIASEYIPKSRRIPRAYNHQWLNDECLRLLEEKYAAEGTSAYADKTSNAYAQKVFSVTINYTSNASATKYVNYQHPLKNGGSSAILS